MRLVTVALLLWTSVAGALVAQEAPVERRMYTTSRFDAAPPDIDGNLGDEAWKSGSWTGDFIQQMPREGDAPSEPTMFKILYDDDNLYVAVRALDSEPERIERRTASRDEFAGDIVGVAFDSYHDLRTAYEFNVTAAGAKVDLMHQPPKLYDFSWDAVWDAATAVNDSGWVAEMRIPLSQLRFSGSDEQVWGLHVWRWIHRYEEESQFSLIPADAGFAVPYFGELHGIRDLASTRRIEVLPYVTGRARTFEPVEGDPFATGSRTFGGTGLDAKVGLSSAFTLDLTLNPDFGQVEADPSTINLTAFETFYIEKRPFFLEGSNLFAYEFEGEELFYSRRIGSAPSYRIPLGVGEYARVPDVTTILGAAKVTGKTRNGLSLGVLESVTGPERALVERAGDRSKLTVEPLTNYFIGRVEKEYREGTTVIGGMFTAVNRRLNQDHLQFLVRDAYAGALSFAHYWRDRTYFVRVNLVGTELRGSQQAIERVQRASVHSIQRPDADYVDFDPTRTRLGGTAGALEVGRVQGRWRFAEEISWQSPGFDVNQAGFMRTPADRINLESAVSYIINQPNAYFRSYWVHLDHSSEWNFGGETNELLLRLRSSGHLRNYWLLYGQIVRFEPYLDMRLLRGGPSLKMPGVWNFGAEVKTDTRDDFQLGIDSRLIRHDGGRTHSYEIEPSASWRASQRLSMSGSLTYERNTNDLQYVTQSAFEGEHRYVLGRIDQETVALTLRASFSLRPNLVIQFYGQPFVSAGAYDHLRVVANPRAKLYNTRFSEAPVLLPALDATSDDYGIDFTGDGIGNRHFRNPDFNFREYRSNLVLRWEYRPGSNLYVVWSQMRSGRVGRGIFDLRDDLSGLYELYPDNVFAIKLSYWLGV